MSARLEGRAPSAATLWFGLLGGPVAWSVAFVVAYLVAESACVRGGSLAGAGVAWLLATGIGVVAAVAAWRARGVAVAGTGEEREEFRSSEARTDMPTGRRFLASSGAALSGLFALISLVHALPLFVGVGCR